MIRAALISTARQYDGEVFADIAPTDSPVIYADEAYDTKANQAWLRARGIRSRILKKEARHIQLTAKDRENNQRTESQSRRNCRARLRNFWSLKNCCRAASSWQM